MVAPPPSAGGWVHEIKHDDYRLQIRIRDGRARLLTRTGIDWTNRYPWIVEAAARLRTASATARDEPRLAHVFHGEQQLFDMRNLAEIIEHDAHRPHTFEALRTLEKMPAS
jgi:hypothetical protein